MSRRRRVSRHRAGSGASAAELLQDEVGTIRKDAPLRVILVYPSPYRVAMSSLGYQTLYRLINDLPGACCERAVLERPTAAGPLLSLESGRRLGDASVLGLSVATESEVGLAARALEISGIPPLETDRRRGLADGRYPLVVAGGPLTYADGSPLLTIADVVLAGEAEDSLTDLVALTAENLSIDELLDRCAELPGAAVAARGARQVDGFALAELSRLPAVGVITTPRAEFGDMFLVEPARGCPRRCSFCVMEPRGFRTASAADVLDSIPASAHRVGLVGAALGHHRELADIVETLVDDGRQVSLSSLRADRLDAELLELLVRGGLRNLAVAADGASERLRELVRKKVTADDLIRATTLAAEAGLRAVKLYAMIGLPTETDEDVRELTDLAARMSEHLPVSIAVSPFVPKARTSLAGAPFTPVPILRKRLNTLRAMIRGRVELRATSARAAWIEHAVASGGFEAGFAAIDAVRDGGSWSAWQAAVKRYGLPAASSMK